MSKYIYKYIIVFSLWFFANNQVTAQSCVANFEYDTAGYIVTFKNISTSSSGIYKSYWNLGDGNYSLDANPIHAYTNPGKYLVFLKVEDVSGNCKDLFMDTVFVVAQSPGCKTAFKIDVQGDSLICKNLSTGVDSSTHYTWSFENQVFSTDENPQWKYTKYGTRSVKLLIQSQSCTDSLQKDIYIKPKYICDATFETSVRADTAIFNPKVYNPNAIYFWDFGDNTTATGSNPSHIYEYNGSYKVALTIEDSVSNCNQNWSSNVSISGLPAFKVNYSYRINKKTVYFEAETKSNSQKQFLYDWKFGDNTNDNGNVVEHTYAAYGTYNVELTVIDTPVSAVITKKFAITLVSDSAYYSLGGRIKLGNGAPADYATVLLIENDSSTSNVPCVVDTAHIIASDSGLYLFSQKKSGRYTLKVLLDKQSYCYQKYLPVYYGNRISWKQAQYFTLNQDLPISVDLNQSTINMNNTGGQDVPVTLTVDKSIKDKYSIENQSVTLFDCDWKPLQTALTDAKGFVKFSHVPNGIYLIKFDIVSKQSSGKLIRLSGNVNVGMVYFKIEGFSVFPYEVASNTDVPQQPDALEDYSLFPVPANDELNIKFAAAVQQNPIQMSIMDASGRIINQRKMTPKVYETIETQTLPSGIYWCVITDNKGRVKNIPFVKK